MSNLLPSLPSATVGRDSNRLGVIVIRSNFDGDLPEADEFDIDAPLIREPDNSCRWSRRDRIGVRSLELTVGLPQSSLSIPTSATVFPSNVHLTGFRRLAIMAEWGLTAECGSDQAFRGLPIIGRIWPIWPDRSSNPLGHTSFFIDGATAGATIAK